MKLFSLFKPKISVDDKIITIFTFEAEYSSGVNILVSSIMFVDEYTSPVFVSLIVLD